MTSLKRKMMLRTQAKQQRTAAQTTSQLARTSQLPLSSIEAGEETVLVGEIISDAPLVAGTVSDHADALESYDPGLDLTDDVHDASDWAYESQALAVEATAAVQVAQAEAEAAAVAAASVSEMAEGAKAAAEAAESAAVEAKTTAEAAQSAAADAAQAAIDRAAEAEAAAKAYAEVEALAAAGDAEAAAVLAAAADAKAKADAAEAAAKEKAAEAQAAADAAGSAASAAAVKADQAREDALRNARYRVGPDGVYSPEMPEGGFRIGAQLVRVNDAGLPYQVDRWNGVGWVRDQILADELLVAGENGTVRIADGKVTAPSLAVDALDFKTASGMSLRSAELVGGRIEQQGSSVTKLTYAHPVTTTTLSDWCGDPTGYTQGAKSSLPDFRPLGPSGLPAPTLPTDLGSTLAVLAQGVGATVGGLRQTKTYFRVPQQYGGCRVIISATFLATGGNATARFGSSTGSGTALTENVWKRVYTPEMTVYSGQLIPIYTDTSLVIAVTSPLVTVTQPGTLSTVIETTDGISRIGFSQSGEEIGRFTGGLLEMRQIGDGERAVEIDAGRIRFRERDASGAPTQRYVKWITADGELALSADRITLNAPVSFQGDTEWNAIPISGGTGTLEWRKRNGEYLLRGSVTLDSALAAGAEKQGLGVMPAGSFPAVPTPILVNVAQTLGGAGIVHASGRIDVRNDSSGAQTAVRIQGSWFQ